MKSLKMSRRSLLKVAALAPAAALVPAVILSPALPLGGMSPARADAPDYAAPPEVFFTQPEYEFVDAAVARIIPDDDLGPGAKEAGVANFINHQLAGPYGRGEDWYMQGPWHQGIEQQGYQLRLTPAQLYRTAIADIEGHVRQKYGKSFAALDPGSQDHIFEALDKGELELPSSHARKFFELLVQNAKEGFLADPIYGGNRDFAGWKLIGFPGPRYNYAEEIEQHGKKYDMPYVSIGGRDTGVAKA
jgi:gluconate 2-dehydrogenase gamma chain